MTYIPNTGQIQVSDLNVLKNVKTATGETDQGSMSSLRNWFRSYVDGAGDPDDNFPGSGDTISFSDFRKVTVFGAAMEMQNETDTTYDDSNNGKLRINGIGGSEDFTFRLQRSAPDAYDTTNTPSGVADAEFTGLGGAASGSQNLVYTLTVTDDTTSASFTLTVTMGLGSTGGKVTGTTTSGTNSTNYNFTGQSASVYSNTLTMYVEDPDGSGRSYGA